MRCRKPKAKRAQIEKQTAADRKSGARDAVLENRRGQVVGIEVKASSTVKADDFGGLRRLGDRLGDDFIVGVVLYTGTATLPFGPKLRAVPVSALWQVG
ncbi:hypothetical protein GCM10009827_020450 [Dactylosporangium maewongense]|uniref:DUF4143 domain-containing protein n=1 Tax=Dactylosporangium maewongense TaxID=634393 RepID=A0ABP4KMN5_9ACTN